VFAVFDLGSIEALVAEQGEASWQHVFRTAVGRCHSQRFLVSAVSRASSAADDDPTTRFGP
jgi:hypothetical protein